MPAKVYGYLANSFGFNDYGRLQLRGIIKDVAETGIIPLEPFEVCAADPEISALWGEINSADSYSRKAGLGREFNRKIRLKNEETMERCSLMIPILDGIRDPGLADEIRFFCMKGLGPVYALHTETSTAETPGTHFHAHTDDLVWSSGGRICKSREEWLQAMEGFYKELKGA